VNDAHGHRVGDEVLCEVARRLGRIARSSDLVARIGGEEFGWVLAGADAAAVRAAAERAREAVAARPFPGVGCVTVSAGHARILALADARD
jgi:diguanylate cyclase (GGDEF)-like protein